MKRTNKTSTTKGTKKKIYQKITNIIATTTIATITITMQAIERQ
jgi:hypothetical protein